MKEQIEKNEVEVKITVNASIERTFDIFTKRCNEWWPSDYKLGEADRENIILEPRVGGRWFEIDADGKEHDWGKVLVWEPPEHLVISWQIGIGYVPNKDPELASKVDIRFVEDGPKQTIIKLVHSEFEKHGKGWENMRDSVAGEGGWPGLFKHLSSLVHGDR